LTARFPSSGHFVGRYDAIVWGDAKAKESWDKQTSFPEGARIIEEHLTRGTDEVGPVMMMQRSNNAWRWTLVASDRRLIVDGESSACSTCHAEAPRDGVFIVK
jgi:hypothetical protein